MIVDLSAAGPIRGQALSIVSRAFAGRRIRLRGVGEDSLRLLTLA